MSRASVFSLLCLVMLSASCNTASKKVNVQQVQVTRNENVLYRFDGKHIVSRLFLDGDSSLVALTQQEPFFTVIDTHTGSRKSTFGRKGRAAGEYLSAPQGTNLREGKLQFYDFAAKSLLSVSVPDGKTELSPVPYRVDFRPLKMVEIQGVKVATGCLANGRIAYIDSGQTVKIGAEYPYRINGLSGIMRGVHLQDDIVAAPNAPRFVVLSIASDCFEIYNVNNDGVERTFVNNFKYPPVIENGRRSFNKSMAGYIRCFVDNENIYLMYAEGSYNEASAGGLVSDTIDQYDWDGALVRTVKLPEKVGAFCVRDSVLFGAVEYPDRSDIVRYVIH